MCFHRVSDRSVHRVRCDRSFSAKGMIYYNMTVLTFRYYYYYDKYVHNIVVVFFFYFIYPPRPHRCTSAYNIRIRKTFFVCSPCWKTSPTTSTFERNTIYDFIFRATMDVDDDHIVIILYYYSSGRKALALLFLSIYLFVGTILFYSLHSWRHTGSEIRETWM